MTQKQKTQLGFLGFDLLALLGVYLFVSDWYMVTDDLLKAKDEIAVNEESSWMLLMVFMPVLHLLTVFPMHIREKLEKPVLVTALLLIVSLCIALSVQNVARIEQAGYVYCADKSERATFSEVSLYLKGGVSC